MLNPRGAGLLYWMLGSCGGDSCSPAMAKLKITKVSTALSSFTDSESGQWLKPVFGALQGYAIDEGISQLGAREVARYFGSQRHIDAMVPKVTHQQSSLAVMMGWDAGLVLDVLLPLIDGHYQNGGVDLDLGDYVVVNPDDKGVPCYHRGLVVNLPLTPRDVMKILEEQHRSHIFMEALRRLKSPVKLPAEYLEALRLTCT